MKKKKKKEKLAITDLRIDNWVENGNGSYVQITLEHFRNFEAFSFFGIVLSEAWLLDFDWPCDRKAVKDTDTDGRWIKNGITLYQDFWTQNEFNYATYVRYDGEFKGGFQIDFVHRLQNLYQAMSGQELIRNPFYTK